MNDRINLLAKQAGLTTQPGKLKIFKNDDGSFSSSEWEYPLEKFSELIVLECIAQTKTDLMQWIQAQAYSGSSHTTHDMGFEKSPDWVSMDEMREYMPSAIDKIKEHFGVE